MAAISVKLPTDFVLQAETVDRAREVAPEARIDAIPTAGTELGGAPVSR